MQGTPTFVIDGKVYGGELSMDDFDEILKAADQVVAPSSGAKPGSPFSIARI